MLEDAAAVMRTYLDSVGLGELSDFAEQRVRQGASAEVLNFELEAHPVWRRRFSAVYERQKKGLTPISAAQQIEFERSAAQMAQAYGMPKSLVGRAQTDALLVGDVSLPELESRMKGAYTRLNNAAPETQAAMQRLYGLGASAGDLAAFVLAPDIALPDIERRVTAIEVGAEGGKQGFTFSREFLESLAQTGVDAGAAKQVFGALSRNRGLTERLAGEMTAAMTQEEATEGLLGLNAASADKVNRRRSGLQAEFGGGTSSAQSSQDGVLGLR